MHYYTLQVVQAKPSQVSLPLNFLLCYHHSLSSHCGFSFLSVLYLTSSARGLQSRSSHPPAHSFGVRTSWRPGQMVSSPGTRGFSPQNPTISHDGRCFICPCKCIKHVLFLLWCHRHKALHRSSQVAAVKIYNQQNNTKLEIGTEVISFNSHEGVKQFVYKAEI